MTIFENKHLYLNKNLNQSQYLKPVHFVYACYVRPDNTILWGVIGMSWHLMSSFDIFFGRKRRQHSLETSWHYDEIQQDFYEKKASP